MEDYIKVVTPCLHADLIDSQALFRIQRLARALPPSPSAFFECRLEDDQSNVDFSIGLSNTISRHLIEDFLTQVDLSNYKSFLLDWIDSKSMLNHYIPSIFLEFDLHIQFSRLPIPCIFLTLDRKFLTDVKYLIKLVSEKFGYLVTPSLKSNLYRCFNSLPNGAIVNPIGLMMSRLNRPIKLSIRGVCPQQLLSYLMQLGLIDVASIFSPITLALEQLVDSFCLSFDVYDSISPKVGLECFLTQKSLDESHWQQLLSYLVELGVCTSVKQNALLAWPGFLQKVDAPELWPSNLAGGDLFLGSRALSVFWREISHIKIIYDLAENSLSAKGYLSFGHSWLDADFLVANSK